MNEQARQSNFPPDNHERLAALYRRADDYLERSDRAAAAGSSVGAREWLQAAEVALAAAARIREVQRIEEAK